MEVTAGVRLKQRRKQLELTQRQVSLRLRDAARRFGKRIAAPAKSTISCWETDRRTPTAFYALLLCSALDSPPEALGLEQVLTPDRVTELALSAGHASDVVIVPGRSSGGLEPPALTAVQGEGLAARSSATSVAGGVDWERLNLTLRTLRRVDGQLVEDQWTLTHHYLQELRTLAASRSHLEVMTGHLERLQRLRRLADRHGHRQELGIMICQSAVDAGISFTDQTNYGLAMEAYELCSELAAELNEPSLQATGLIMQAQLYGGQLHSRLPRQINRQRRLLDAAEQCASSHLWPEARHLVGSIAAQVHAEFGHEAAAKWAMEVAKRAESDTDPASWPYCGLGEPIFRKTMEGLAESMLGRRENGVGLLSQALAELDAAGGWPGYRVWLELALGSTYTRAGALELAAPRIADALRLAREAETPFLLRATEALAEGLVGTAPREPAVQALREELHIA